MEIRGEDRRLAPTAPINPLRKESDGDGPAKPGVQRPDTSDLLKRMKRVDPDTAKKYRQRSGE